MNSASGSASGLATYSNVLQTGPKMTNLEHLAVKKVERWQTIRDVLPAEFLQSLAPAALRAAVDGIYAPLTIPELKDFRRLAKALAQTTMVITRIGRGSMLAQLIREYRK